MYYEAYYVGDIKNIVKEARWRVHIDGHRDAYSG